MNKELKMWVEGNTINIQVTSGYIYDAYYLTKMGKESDHPGTQSVWGWINHMRPKRWWNEMNERKFLLLATKILTKKDGKK